MRGPILFLTMGYPGSGKSSVAKIIHELTGAHHIWADKEREKMFDTPTHDYKETRKLYDRLDKVAENLLASGKSVVYDTNFNFYIDRRRMSKLAKQYGADYVLIWVKVPAETAIERATGSEDLFGTRVYKNMPKEHVKNKIRNLQEPRENEPHIEIDGTKLTREYIADLLRGNGLL